VSNPKKREPSDKQLLSDISNNVLDWVLRRLDGLSGPNAAGWYRARCPACGGQAPLAIKPYATTSFVHKCFKGGCSAEEILLALNGQAPQRTTVPPSSTTSNIDLGDQAREIWEASKRAPNTLVAKYLASRGITLKPPPALRFHPSLYHPSHRRAPAMVALAHDASGQPTAILRTWLREPIFGLTIGKADFTPNKMLLGPCRGGAVRLGPIRSKLALAEGIETALSVTQLTGLVCWAGVGANLTNVVLPRQVHEVVLAVDGDEQGDGYLAELSRRFKAEGRRVRAMQAQQGKDWNDIVREGVR
jgi:putative DNA primase/helicase